MPFYLACIALPLAWAPASEDLGGMTVFVHFRTRARKSAEAELRRLQRRDEELLQQPGVLSLLLTHRNRVRTIIEAADRREARRLAEIEAYHRLGVPRPARFQCYALRLRSISSSEVEVFEKHVEVIAGPFTSLRALAAAAEAADLGEAHTESMEASWLRAIESWPDAHGMSEGVVGVRAADEWQAVHELGVCVSQRAPRLDPAAQTARSQT